MKTLFKCCLKIACKRVVMYDMFWVAQSIFLATNFSRIVE